MAIEMGEWQKQKRLDSNNDFYNSARGHFIFYPPVSEAPIPKAMDLGLDGHIKRVCEALIGLRHIFSISINNEKVSLHLSPINFPRKTRKSQFHCEDLDLVVHQKLVEKLKNIVGCLVDENVASDLNILGKCLTIQCASEDAVNTVKDFLMQVGFAEEIYACERRRYALTQSLPPQRLPLFGK